jgi:hypothetical protein
MNHNTDNTAEGIIARHHEAVTLVTSAPIWHASMELRWKRHYSIIHPEPPPTLQQAWHSSSGEIEWRDVPVK